MNEASETQLSRPSFRFGMAQMMIAMAICALVLACSFSGTHIPGRPKPGINAGNVIFGMADFTVGMFSCLGGAIVVANWIRDRRMPADPGSLLFLFCAIAFLIGNAMEILYAVVVGKLESSDPTARVSYGVGFLYVRCITQLFLAFVCAFGFRRNRWWWQVGFLGLMLAMLAQFGMTVLSFSLHGPNSNGLMAFGYVRLVVGVVSTVVVFGLFLCGVIDLARKEKRTRLHWLGVLCFLMFWTLPAITRLVAARYFSLQELYGV